MHKLDNICEAFGIETPLKSIETLQSGHINDTYLVTQQNDEKFIIQKLNSLVFKNAKAVIANKIVISEHLQANYKKTNSHYQSVNYLKTTQNEYIFKEEKSYWNVMRFITNALTIDKAETPQIAFEAGKLYGDFILNTESILPESITETLKDFHNVPFRLTQFETALKLAKSNRLEAAADLIAFVKKHATSMSTLASLQAKNHFPIRITHNDAKLSNILFDTKNKGLAVIDLDTVMPGLVHYDFGDSVRSICTKSTEDETDLSKIYIDLELYEAYCKGFALKTKSILKSEEIENLPLGVQTIIYIMGLRFLTDFLNNDTYYKTAYANHNFDRALNQFTVLQSVIDNLESIERITKQHFT
ncbi:MULTISPECIES: phosphotransferase enzyme family protein [Bizionia]|uniref:Aminoglycoside phosphotransferase family protein n=1 Tax=Bizionia algoritergicola TaxID=291187 RepID=A0A5D0QWV5_9FLAO|nr:MULTISPECIES: aminoglycoside phosphotransferase family protein [Bizionia]OBX21447.1 phosphotransferase [Bizionia sp. APA-3]TYB73697.1 aminoglycoside phosphotransferase family protein [Bizionia algoritergicola]